ncbi:unnamed protein product, partial [marine sediment metagenome]
MYRYADPDTVWINTVKRRKLVGYCIGISPLYAGISVAKGCWAS